MSRKLGLIEKSFWSVLNGIEQAIASENFIIANLSDYDEIFADGIMSVRHYHPLEEDEIEIPHGLDPNFNEIDSKDILIMPPGAPSSSRTRRSANSTTLQPPPPPIIPRKSLATNTTATATIDA